MSKTILSATVEFEGQENGVSASHNLNLGGGKDTTSFRIDSVVAPCMAVDIGRSVCDSLLGNAPEGQLVLRLGAVLSRIQTADGVLEYVACRGQSQA